MIKLDYHSHSFFSPDSYATIDEMAEMAIELGIEEYAVTDHVDFLHPSGKLANAQPMSRYVNAVLEKQRNFAGRLKILLGVEFGLRMDSIASAEKIAAEYDFDIIIGSTHEYLDGTDYYLPNFYGTKAKQEAYTAYFENMLNVINACDCFDVVGHLDYIERYGRYNDKTLHYKDYAEVIDAVLRAVIQKGKGIELNTSGLAYGLGHAHPCSEILRRYKELGGEILTVGSDAHRPVAVGQYFENAKKILEDVGIKYITSFENRKPTMVKI